MNLELATPNPNDDDDEIDTPPHTHTHSITTSVFKNHHRHLPVPPVVYRGCMKNHAATIGGHAVDGCGEYLPSPDAAPTDPTSLKCAACGCHRNFHRREPDFPIITPQFLDFRHPKQPSPSPSPSPRYAPHSLLALSTAVAAEEHHQDPVTPTAENPVCRKRSRTKFSQEQKEKMLSFSEKMGWKVSRCNEADVEEICHEIGVSKGVLKVWMHNNKNVFCKREMNGIINGGGGIKNQGNFKNANNGGGAHHHGSNNGSCSSDSP